MPSNSIAASLRAGLLPAVNVGRLRRFFKGQGLAGRTPVFLVLTRELVHMAPLAVAVRGPGFQPVFVFNGVSLSDKDWLRDMVGDIPDVSLMVSLTGNPLSVLDHGTVIEYLLDTYRRPFCIQDPDCFVTDRNFFQSVKLDEAGQYAAGPFTKEISRNCIRIPDTFFLYLNAPLFLELQSRYGLRARTTRQPPARLAGLLEKGGFPAGTYPGSSKVATTRFRCSGSRQRHWVRVSGSSPARARQSFT